MVYTPETVVSYGFPIDDFTFTYSLAAAVGASNVGGALTLDTSVASTFKLAGDADPVQGRLFSYEDREVSGIKTGAVQRKFKEKLPAIDSHGIAVGDSVCGSATPGTVRKAISGNSDPITNLVVEVGTDFVVVESF